MPKSKFEVLQIGRPVVEEILESPKGINEGNLNGIFMNINLLN